jgi:hypothetical protein
VSASRPALIPRLAGASPATLLFCAAVALSGGVLLSWLSDLTFWRDEWAFILNRRGSGIDTYLDPFVEQLLAIPVASYKLLIAVFGIDSPIPFQVASTLVFLASVVVLFLYVRKRVGEWLALAAALPILFLGPSWDDLLFPFQISFFGSVACGLGALLALDREDRRGDLIACVLLAIGLFCSHVGIPFVVAATVDIGLTRERFRRAFVVVVPTALWMAWYLGWGREAQNFVSFHNFTTLPGYVADGFSASLSTLLGLAVPRDEAVITSLDWGRPLLVVAIAAGLWRVSRAGLRAFSRRLWAVLAMGLGFWSLTGLNASFFGQATSGRYQYMGAIFIILIAAELLRGVVVRRWIVGAVLVVSLLATLANFSYLRDNAIGLAGIAVKEKGGLAALELTRGLVAPDFELTEENSGVDYLGALDAGPYFSAIDAYGSPAYTPAELAGSDEQARVSADMVFAAALGIELAPAEGDAAGVGPCTEVRVGPGPQVVPLPPGGVELEPRSGSSAVALRRYASEEFPVELGRLGPGQPRRLEIPADLSPQPWQMSLAGRGRVSICELGGTA